VKSGKKRQAINLFAVFSGLFFAAYTQKIGLIGENFRSF
jgi:hypothetical protein